jgi:hypothetical protein
MASPSLHGVPRDGSPASTILWDAPTPRRPSRPVRFFTSRYHRVARGFPPSVVGVPPGARELSVPVSPSGLTMETSGSLRLLGNPGGHCPCSSTPVGSGRLSGPRVSCLTRPPPAGPWPECGAAIYLPQARSARSLPVETGSLGFGRARKLARWERSDSTVNHDQRPLSRDLVEAGTDWQPRGHHEDRW